MVSVESSTAFSRRPRTMLTARVATSAGSHARLATARTRTHHRSAPEPQDVGKRHVGTNLYPSTSRRLHRPPHDVRVAGVKAAGDVDGRNVLHQLRVVTELPPAVALTHIRVQVDAIHSDPSGVLMDSRANNAGLGDRVLELPECFNRLVGGDCLEVGNLARPQLAHLAEVSADDGGDLRVTAQARTIDMEDNRLEPTRHLDASDGNRVINDV